MTKSGSKQPIELPNSFKFGNFKRKKPKEIDFLPEMRSEPETAA